MILHEFLIGFKIRICKSNQNQAGCCSGDPVLVFNHRFRIEYHSKLVVKVEFSVLIYENEKWSMASSLKDASPSIPSCVSWARLRFNLLQYLQDTEMLARSVQLWSCFLVTVEGTSIKSHLSVPLLTLFLHIHSADMLLPMTLDKTAWARNQCWYENSQEQLQIHCWEQINFLLMKAHLLTEVMNVAMWQDISMCLTVSMCLNFQVLSVWKCMLIWAEDSIADSNNCEESCWTDDAIGTDMTITMCMLPLKIDTFALAVLVNAMTEDNMAFQTIYLFVCCQDSWKRCG